MLASFVANCTLAAFLIGIATASYGHPHPTLWFNLLVLGLLGLVWKWRWLWIVTGCLLGFLYTSLWRSHYYTDYPFGQNLTIRGEVVEPPDIRTDSIFLTVQPEGKPTRILVTTARFPLVRYGQRVEVRGEIERPEAFEQFNYPLYLERFHIYAIMRKPQLKIIGEIGEAGVLGKLYSLREHLEKQIQTALPEPEGAFLAGILLGSKRAIPDSIQGALRQTGTSHIIAISGANITILLGIILQLLPLSGRRRQLAATMGISGFVVLLTGASASVVRGAVVACLGRYLKLCSRRAWATPFLLFSMTLLLLNNPLLLMADPGFQLSFAAFAGLAYFGSPFGQFLKNFRFTKPWPEIIRASLAETTAATLGTAFISLKIFGQLSLLGLIVNPLVLWLLPPITSLGLLVLTLGWLPGVIPLLRIPLWLLLHAALQIIMRFGTVTIGVIHLA